MGARRRLPPDRVETAPSREVVRDFGRKRGGSTSEKEEPALMHRLSLLIGATLLGAMSTLQPPTEASVCLKSGSVYTCTDTGNPVTNGVSLQNTVNAASCGDTIVIPAGVEHRNATGTSGNPVVILPNKSCGTNQYVTIQSSAAGRDTGDLR